MWTAENRGRYARKGLRYPSDTTDSEWAIIAGMIPPAKRGGRKREVDTREVVNALLYVLETGCPWGHLPKDLPPKSTVYDYFDLWAWDGTLQRIHDALYIALREKEGREASPTAAIVDSQSVRSMPKGGSGSIRLATMRARRPRVSSAIS
jgi:transposase